MLLRSARLACLALLIGSLAGCNGGKLNATGTSSASTTAPSTSGTNPGNPPPPPPPPPPSFAVQSAVWADADKSGAASKGDTVTVTFSKEVKLSGTDPSKDLALPVQGDSWGTGATMAAGSKPVDVVVTLGDKPVLRISGKFDPSNPGQAGDPSGVDVSSATTITDLQGNKPSSYPIDIDGTATPSFAVAGTMQVARGQHTATLLDDGRVLVVGGLAAGTGGPSFALEPEVYDPLAATFTKADDPALGGAGGVMTTPALTTAPAVGRVWHTATKLTNGQVLITGGFGFDRDDPAAATPAPKQEDLKSAHLFDPKTNTFSLVQNTMSISRDSHYAAMLSNGKVLIAGGISDTLNSGQGATLPAAEIFDPTAGTFTPLSSTGQDMVAPRQNGAFAAIPAKKQVLFSGGIAIAMPQGATQVQPFLSGGAEAFDETSSKFAATASNPATDLRGNVAVAFGSKAAVFGGDNGQAPSTEIDVYDAATGKFAPGGALKAARSLASAAAFSSREAAVGGGTTLSGQPGAELKSVELFDLTANNVTTSIDMKNARNGAIAVKLATGGVIFIGGFNGDNGQSAMSLGGQPVGDAEKLQIP
jgi:hypothetical protein